MKTIENLINKHKGRQALIIAAGSSVKEYENKINSFIHEEKPITIGINNKQNFLYLIIIYGQTLKDLEILAKIFYLNQTFYWGVVYI